MFASEFVTYKGTFGDKISGKLDTEAASLGITLEGQGSSTLMSHFGKLMKETLDEKKLLDDTCNRYEISPFVYSLRECDSGRLNLSEPHVCGSTE